jgi:hypothetical protein
VAFRLALAYVVVVIRRLVRQAWTSTAGRSALAAAHDHRPPRRLRPRFGNQAGERGVAPLRRLVSASVKASRSALSTSSVPTNRAHVRIDHRDDRLRQRAGKGRQVAWVSGHIVDHQGALGGNAPPLTPWVTGSVGAQAPEVPPANDSNLLLGHRIQPDPAVAPCQPDQFGDLDRLLRRP